MKRHKMKYRSPRRISLGPRSSDREMERKAREYALWLAQRDSVTLPDTYQVTAIWSGVHVGMVKREKRIRAVKFGDLEITLPNWDFVAHEPVEHCP